MRISKIGDTLFQTNILKSKKSFGEILRIIRSDLDLAKLDHLKLRSSAENLALLQKQRYSSEPLFKVTGRHMGIVWFT